MTLNSERFNSSVDVCNSRPPARCVVQLAIVFAPCEILDLSSRVYRVTVQYAVTDSEVESWLMRRVGYVSRSSSIVTVTVCCGCESPVWRRFIGREASLSSPWNYVFSLAPTIHSLVHSHEPRRHRRYISSNSVSHRRTRAALWRTI